MLQGTNRLRSCQIITLVFLLQKKIEYCYKTPIQPTTAKLNTADGSPMSAIGMTALHLRITEFKFIHNFIICDQLPETEIILGIDMQQKFSLSYAWDKEGNCYIQREGKFPVYTNNCDCKATICTVKSTLKIPLWHNGVMPIKISGPIIEEHMAYFIMDDNTSKGRDPNVNIISSFHKIKGRTSVNILVSNYTNKHLTFHKGEYVRHLEPAVSDDSTIEQGETHQTNSVTLKKWWWRKSHLTSSIHHTMNCPTISNMTSMPYWRSMNPNLQRTKPQLELHLSPAWW